jgi:hypothetical protein
MIGRPFFLATRRWGPAIAPELKRRMLLREVNGRIREISDRFGTPEGTYRLICECGREDCEERVEVPVSAYEEARRSDGFLVAPGHAEPTPKGASSSTLMPALVPADPLRLQ